MTEQPEPTGEIHGLDADRTADQVTAFAEATGTALEDWQKDYIRAAVGERRPTAYDPPADPIAALRDALARIDAATREVLVHPDTPAVVVERITSASPLVRVRRSSLVPRPDVVLVSRPDGQGPLVVRKDDQA